MEKFHHCPKCGHLLYYNGKVNTPFSDSKFYKCKYCEYEIEIPLKEDWSQIKCQQTIKQ